MEVARFLSAGHIYVKSKRAQAGDSSMSESLADISQGFKRFQFTMAVLLWTCLCVPAFAKEGASRGTVTLSYQFVREGKVNISTGKVDIGTSYTQSLLLDVEFFRGFEVRLSHRKKCFSVFVTRINRQY